MRKQARRGKVVHFALTVRSTVSYCSFLSRIDTPYGARVASDAYIVDLDLEVLPPETPVTCLACLVEAGFEVV